MVCAMRERTAFPRAVIEKLPDLKLLITTGMRNASIDVAAAKEEVERAQALMRTILDNMKDGVTLLDKNFNWLFSNRIHIARQRYTPAMLHPVRFTHA